MKRKPPIELLLANRFLLIVVVVVLLALVVEGESAVHHHDDTSEAAATTNGGGGQKLLRGGIAATTTALEEDMENALPGQRVEIIKELYGNAFVGCFLGGSSASVETDDVAACLVHCLEQEYEFAAIQKLTECSCSNDYSIFGTPASSNEECEREEDAAAEKEVTANLVFATKHTSVTTPRRAFFKALKDFFSGSSHVSDDTGTDAPTEGVTYGANGQPPLGGSLEGALEGALPKIGLATSVPTYELTIDGSEYSSYSEAPTPSPKPGKKPEKPEKPDKEKKSILGKIGSLLFGGGEKPPETPKPKPKPKVVSTAAPTSATTYVVTEALTYDFPDYGGNGQPASLVGDLLGYGTSPPAPDYGGNGQPASLLDTIKDKFDDFLGISTSAPTSGATVGATIAGTVEATFDASGSDFSEAPTPSPKPGKPKGVHGSHPVNPPPGVKLSGNPGAKTHHKTNIATAPPGAKTSGTPGGLPMPKPPPKLGSSQAAASLTSDGLKGVKSIVQAVLGTHGEAYMGCYKDVPLAQAMHFGSHSNHNIGTCRAYCKEEGYDFAGLEKGHMCFCDNCYDTYGKADSDDLCDEVCTMAGGSSTDICGGSTYLSVYASRDPTSTPTLAPTVTPSPTGESGTEEVHKGYRGCFPDNPASPVMSHKASDDHSIESCITYCKGEEYDYAGLKAGNECYCSNTYKSPGQGPASEMACNILCTEGGGGMCGGTQKLSVFATNVEEKD